MSLLINNTSESFFKTGHLSDEILETSRTMNPSYALFNCPVMCYQTVHLLEFGSLPKMDLWFPSMPRCMPANQTLKIWPNLLERMAVENRRVSTDLGQCTIEILEDCMKKIGPGTHAMIGGTGKFGVVSHCWNYVYTRENQFKILDSYSKSYHREGLENPEKYLNRYEGFRAVVFHDCAKDPINLMYATLPPDLPLDLWAEQP